MPYPKKPYKPKAGTFRAAAATFPDLHDDVFNALRDDLISPPWRFNPAGNDGDALEAYPTFIMGRFHCCNRACAMTGWGSKRIAILIRRFPNNGYDAVVFKQRCKGCKKIGRMRIDESCYVERVVYRLRKWAGVEVEKPEYNGDGSGPPHEEELCEGCRRGYCQRR